MSDPRLVEVPKEQRETLSRLVDTYGLAAACRQTGLGRVAVLGILARGSCMRAHAALLATYIERRQRAEAQIAQLTGQVAAALKGDR